MLTNYDICHINFDCSFFTRTPPGSMPATLLQDINALQVIVPLSLSTSPGCPKDAYIYTKIDAINLQIF